MDRDLFSEDSNIGVRERMMLEKSVMESEQAHKDKTTKKKTITDMMQ